MAAKRFLLCILLDQCWSSFCGLDLLGKQKSRPETAFLLLLTAHPLQTALS